MAFEHGYQVIVPDMTNTTYDNGEISGQQIYELINLRILKDRFVRFLPMAETIAVLEGGGNFSAAEP